jgi:hypothetical protein
MPDIIIFLLGVVSGVWFSALLWSIYDTYYNRSYSKQQNDIYRQYLISQQIDWTAEGFRRMGYTVNGEPLHKEIDTGPSVGEEKW